MSISPEYWHQKKKAAEESEIRNGLRFADVDNKLLIEAKAARMGLTYADYCRERDRIKLPSGGFTREIWEVSDLMARKNMMDQLSQMPTFTERLENWASW